MPLSPDGLSFLMHEEGLKTSPYPDSGGKLTIGCGHLLTAGELASGNLTIAGVVVPWRNGITMPQVQSLLAQDYAPREAALSKILVCPLTDNQFAACFSLYFNAQPPASASVWQILNGGDWTDLDAHWKVWNHVNGVVDPELTGRRARELVLFHTVEG